jgi:competence protein ComEC
MNSSNETPLFRFLLVFICGILVAIYFPFIPTVVCGVAILFSLSVFYFLFAWKIKNVYRHRWIAPLAGLVFTFFSGYLLTDLANDKQCASHFRNKINSEGYIGFISQPPIEKEKSFKSTIKVVSVQADKVWLTTTGNCLIYFSKDSLSSKLKYGDLIYFSTVPEEVKPPANPSQFDYKKWLGFNHIYDQVFLQTDKWKLLEHDRGYKLFALSYSLRDKLLSIFSDNKIAGQEYAVLSALILGCSDEIDQEVISAYAASGALHVLSVSGLHVGIIYVAINFLLSFLDKKRKTRILKSIVIILFLWFYALLTGLSPSVLRSAMMLSFIIIGSLKRHHTKLYNTLAASAFFLLCLDPYLIMQVGFQLSYTAVLGIILLYQPIHSWIDSRVWIVRQVWSVTAVSLAAQTITFPLGLLYFHQFPVYFLLSNLVVIPISTVIIYGGISLLAFSGWHFVAALIGAALSWIVHGMNAIVIGIEHLPFSLITGISVSILETCLMYGVIGAIISFFTLGEQKYILYAFSMIVLILASQINELVLIRQQKQIVVFSMKGYSVVNFIDGRKNLIYADEKIINDRRAMIFNMRNYWWDCGLDENGLKVFQENKPVENYLLYRNFIQFDDSRILILKDTAYQNASVFNLPIDILLISDNIKVNLKDLLSRFHFRKIIIDSSCSLKVANRLVKEAAELGIDIYSVPDKGAFVYDLQRK